MRKYLKIITLSVLLLILIAFLVIYLGLNGIVRSVVQSQSASSLNVATSLKSANVSLFGGELSLSNFVIGSPPGFKAPQLMSLGGIKVGVKLGDLRGEPIRINEIHIKDPRMLIEMQGLNFNIKKFIDNLPAGEDKPTAEGKPPMKLIINDLKVEGAKVVFRPDVAALSQLKDVKQEYVLPIPTLELKDIGTGDGNQNGAAVKEVVSLLVTSLAAKATESDQLPPELRDILHLNVKDLTELAKAKLGQQVDKQLGKVAADLSKKVGGDAGKALEGVLKSSPDGGKDLGGLLGGKKKKAATQP